MLCLCRWLFAHLSHDIPPKIAPDIGHNEKSSKFTIR